MRLPFGRTAAFTAMAASSSTPSSLAIVRNATTCSGTSSYQSRITKLATGIRPRVLMTTRGSGNYGESSGKVSFYTIDKLQMIDWKRDETATTKLERVDLDLEGDNDRLAFYIDNVLTHDEADILAACAEAILEDNGHSRMAPGIQTPSGMRINEAAHWYPSNALAPKLLGHIFDRIRPLVPSTLDGLPLYHRLSEKIAHFKYNKGDQFNRHTDGLFPGQGSNEAGTGINEWTGVVSGMSMLFYLNDSKIDGLSGGETRLWSADGSKHVDVSPKKGRVLFFRRGSPDAVLHAGLPVTGEVPKYMALINLAYGEQTGTKLMLT